MNKVTIGVLAALGPVYAVTAHSEVYMTEQKAAELLLKDEAFDKKAFELSADDIKAIESDGIESVRAKNLNLFKGKQGSVVFIDQVLGKHEFITYATAVGANGAVKGVEIIEYRETYGHQVRKDSWRKQFVGKNKDSELKIDHDIANISGATLSSVHITSGVKRLLKTYDVIKKRL